MVPMRLARELAIGLAGTLAVALLQAVAPGASLGRFLLIGLIGTLLTLGVIVLLSSRRSQAPVVTPPPASPPASAAPPVLVTPNKPGRIYVPAHVTPSFLVEQVRRVTSLQRDHVVGVYIGKWLKYSGTIYDIGKGYKSVTVSSFTEPIEHHVRMNFAESWLDQISMLRKDDAIAVIGKLESVDAIGVYLEDCELIETPPAEQT